MAGGVYWYPEARRESHPARVEGNLVRRTVMHFWRSRRMLYFVLIRRIPDINERRVERLASVVSLSKWLDVAYMCRNT